ncbi:MAG: trypsin-like peptidase domain-containing protein [Lachnospiraceae bacterium]|nr:trypsin-like peptidase domain-containing protein [Lachnospiraceae bacterium]
MYENNYPNNNTYYYESGGNYSGSGGGFHNESGSPGGNAGRPDKSRKTGLGTGKKIVIAVCCGLFFGIFAGLGFQAVDSATDYLKAKAGIGSWDDNEDKAETQTEEVSIDSTQPEGESAQAAENQIAQATVTDVTEVVKQVMPSVVSVNNSYIERMSFFGYEYSQPGGGSGSGIIVGQNDTELLLVTNYHVVESAEELTVQFVDGTQAQAQLKGSDADKDLAVIAVQLDNIDKETMDQISIAKLGSSDSLTVGEPVIAIGNALGYGQSVTTGVVSALDRAIAATSVQTVQNSDVEINTFIQTDAAINPGNSGGALLNIKGEVIGINSNKIGGSAVEGMGYAIPISDAQPIIENLMSKATKFKVDEAKRGYLGITGVDVAAENSQLYGMPQGVYVSSVMEGSGAEKAGLVRGDIITAINGDEVKSMAELKEELTYCEAGATIELTIMQGSPVGYQSKSVEVTLGHQNS